jgi:DNA repair protein RecO (recombination protein O)
MVGGLANSATYTTEAICLKSLDYGEADRIVQVYSRDRGRISVIAKGAKKGGSKLAGGCELLTVNRYQLAHGKNMATLCQYQTIESFVRNRADLLRLGYGLLFAELVLLLATEGDVDSERIYDLLKQALERLEALPPDAGSDIVVRIATAFQMELLNAAGYRPVLSDCVSCGDELDMADPWYAFSRNQGGVLCADCRHQTPDASVVKVSTSTLKNLSEPPECFIAETWTHKHRLKIQKFLQFYLSHQLEKQVRSYDFVLQLLEGEAGG